MSILKSLLRIQFAQSGKTTKAEKSHAKPQGLRQSGFNTVSRTNVRANIAGGFCDTRKVREQDQALFLVETFAGPSNLLRREYSLAGLSCLGAALIQDTFVGPSQVVAAVENDQHALALEDRRKRFCVSFCGNASGQRCHYRALHKR